MFGKEKEPKEFFEVFKKPHDAEDRCDSKVLQRDKMNPTVLPRRDNRGSENNIDTEPEPEVLVEEENRETEQLGWIQDSRKEVGEVPADTTKARKPSRNEVLIKQETLIFSALGAVFLSLACFFVGYKIGIKNVLNPEALQKSVEYPVMEGGVKSVPKGKKINAVDLTTKKPLKVVGEKVGNIKWTLQIISYSDTRQHIKKARDLAKAIKNMTNHNTFVAKRGKEIVVCAGKFNSKDSNELKKALSEISKLEYEGKKQFASSYPIQVR